MTDKPSTPGTYLPVGIVVADEPAQANVAVFVDAGNMLLTLDLQPGGNVSQIMIGLTAHQVLQLIERFSTHADVFGRAIVEGRGGMRFPDRA